MSFKVSARGVAAKHKYYILSNKVFADPGKVIKGMGQLQELADKGKVPLGGLSDNYKKAANKLASINVNRLFGDAVEWYDSERAKIKITYSKKGVFYGMWTPPEFRSGDIIFGGGGKAIAQMRFVNLLKRMKLNRWGYLRGIIVPMVEYETHCEQYGINRYSGAFLTIKIDE